MSPIGKRRVGHHGVFGVEFQEAVFAADEYRPSLGASRVVSQPHMSLSDT